MGAGLSGASSHQSNQGNQQGHGYPQTAVALMMNATSGQGHRLPPSSESGHGKDAFKDLHAVPAHEANLDMSAQYTQNMAMHGGINYVPGGLGWNFQPVQWPAGPPTAAGGGNPTPSGDPAYATAAAAAAAFSNLQGPLGAGNFAGLMPSGTAHPSHGHFLPPHGTPQAVYAQMVPPDAAMYYTPEAFMHGHELTQNAVPASAFMTEMHRSPGGFSSFGGLPNSSSMMIGNVHLPPQQMPLSPNLHPMIHPGMHGGMANPMLSSNNLVAQHPGMPLGMSPMGNSGGNNSTIPHHSPPPPAGSGNSASGLHGARDGSNPPPASSAGTNFGDVSLKNQNRGIAENGSLGEDHSSSTGQQTMTNSVSGNSGNASGSTFSSGAARTRPAPDGGYVAKEMRKHLPPSIHSSSRSSDNPAGGVLKSEDANNGDQSAFASSSLPHTATVSSITNPSNYNSANQDASANKLQIAPTLSSSGGLPRGSDRTSSGANGHPSTGVRREGGPSERDHDRSGGGARQRGRDSSGMTHAGVVEGTGGFGSRNTQSSTGNGGGRGQPYRRGPPATAKLGPDSNLEVGQISPAPVLSLPVEPSTIPPLAMPRGMGRMGTSDRGGSRGGRGRGSSGPPATQGDLSTRKPPVYSTYSAGPGSSTPGGGTPGGGSYSNGGGRGGDRRRDRREDEDNRRGGGSERSGGGGGGRSRGSTPRETEGSSKKGPVSTHPAANTQSTSSVPPPPPANISTEST